MIQVRMVSIRTTEVPLERLAERPAGILGLAEGGRIDIGTPRWLITSVSERRVSKPFSYSRTHSDMSVV
jgi:hypothetical protein